MLASTESKTTESLSASGARRRCHGAVSGAIQVLLFGALGAAVLVALFYDSRLYYGIDVDGQPIHKETPLSAVSPVSTGSAVGSDEFDHPNASWDTTFLGGPHSDKLCGTDQDRLETVEASS